MAPRFRKLFHNPFIWLSAKHVYEFYVNIVKSEIIINILLVYIEMVNPHT